MRPFAPIPRAAAVAVLTALTLAACRPAEEPLFVARPPEATGVTFANTLVEDSTFNILNYLYYYNGGGVAAGDVNGDGRVDLYFTANQGPNRLYLNRGDWRFEDVTDAAGVAGTADWTTGVTMADVDGDGRLDLYVSALDGYEGRRGCNAYFHNEGAPAPGGVPVFTERAAETGLDACGYATQAAFFDADADGDLDVYQLRHSTHTERTLGDVSLRDGRHPTAGDRFLRNDDGAFVDVTEAAGILSSRIGYGLGVVVTDANGDGRPDLYVANDFHENDYLYLNRGDGTFREAVGDAMGHTSRFSMGVDAGDVDGDGRMDLVVLDMLPWRPDVLQTSENTESHTLEKLKLDFGYHPQYARNTLQWNRGVPAGDDVPAFSDVGYQAGVEATDWSWGALFADLDLDGRQDLFVTNGIWRRPNDLDYINYVSNQEIQASLAKGITRENLRLVERMPHVPLPNRAFRNAGGRRFEEVGAAWGLDAPGFSNGAAYADLDGDGDLDLVVNELNGPARLYENRARETTGRHALTVRLEGEGRNPFGVGARVEARAAGRRIVREAAPTRGWLSSVPMTLHLGLDTLAVVDTLTVTWPDGRRETRTRVAAGGTVTLRQAEAAAAPASPPRSTPWFEGAAPGFAAHHEENAFADLDRERLMPHGLSREGPALAVGDVDGDGLDDVFLGGAKRRPAQLWRQRPDGGFDALGADVWRADSLHEDVDAAFFDADADGDLDLYVVSGGNEYGGEADPLRDRLYRNDGRGGFRRDDAALPDGFANGGVVAPGDVDGDGDLDLFVGARVTARAYGAVPRSVLLENDGAGVFRDVTDARAPGLAAAGLVADAAWTDVDGDGDADLVAVGEWMPVRVYRNDGGRLAEATGTAGLAGSEGWWNAVTAADLDGDGDADLVLGNLGTNSLVRADADRPARLYRADFDGNGSADPVFAVYRADGRSYPMATRAELQQQLQPLRKRYPTNAAFGGTDVDALLGRDARTADVLEARWMASAVAWNDGGTFTLRALPDDAQLAPVYAALPLDGDGDGRLDLLLAGNQAAVPPVRGRYDASYGTVLRGDGRGGFAPVDPERAGVWLRGDVRALARLRTASGTDVVLVARNDDTLLALRLRAPAAVPHEPSRP